MYQWSCRNRTQAKHIFKHIRGFLFWLHTGVAPRTHEAWPIMVWSNRYDLLTRTDRRRSPFDHLDSTLPISYNCSRRMTPQILLRLEGASTELSKTRTICTIPCAVVYEHIFKSRKPDAKCRHAYRNLQPLHSSFFPTLGLSQTNSSCGIILGHSSCSMSLDSRHLLPGGRSLIRKFMMMQTTIFGGSYRSYGIWMQTIIFCSSDVSYRRWGNYQYSNSGV